MTGTVLKPEHRDRIFGHHSPGPHRRHEVPGVLAWAASSYLELDGWRYWAMPGGGDASIMIVSPNGCPPSRSGGPAGLRRSAGWARHLFDRTDGHGTA